MSGAVPIGGLSERVSLIKRTQVSEAEGGTLTTYASIATVWARVRVLSARPSFAADARGQATSHAVVVRRRGDIGPGDRIGWKGRTLEILSVAPLEADAAYSALSCSEQVVTG